MQADRFVQMAALKRSGQLVLHLHSLCQEDEGKVSPEKGCEMQLLTSCYTGAVPSGLILSALARQEDYLFACLVHLLWSSLAMLLACHHKSTRKAEGQY